MSTALMVQDTGDVPGSTQEEKEATLRYWNSFNLDQYYSKIESYTYATEFVEFKKEEGLAFLKWSRAAAQTPLATEPSLSSLLQRIDDACDKIRARIPNCTRLFIKLSSRSAKDSVDKRPDFLLPYLRTRLQDSDGPKDEDGLPISLNSQVVALRKAFLDTMAVSSASGALEQFSFSARIVSDLKRVRLGREALRVASPLLTKFVQAIDFDQWDLHIVVREYSDVPIHGELRGIVCDGKLTGLSQYYTECFFPQLVQNKDAIGKAVRKFQRKFHKHVEHQSYIFDIVVYDDMTIKLVELNPFGTHTGIALFKWDGDAALIKDGPLEFRIREEVLPDSHLNAILSTWKHLVGMTIQQPKQGNNLRNEKCTVS